MTRSKITERKQSPEYQAIIQALYNYWLSEPDELEVTVAMKFIHSGGMHQEKCIHWINRELLPDKPQKIELVSATELLQKEFSPDGFPQKYFK